ncbi:MAG: T9SS C-terminal target domain-containing protein [Ignavibacteriae bacterium]|nr:MAG: T9SS C-terminal target domain-containing protein [Ignavibacteriota bacterium]
MKNIYLFIFILILSAALFSAINNSENKKLYNNTPTLPEGDWFEKQRAFPFDEIPEDEHLKSIEYVKNNMQVDAPGGLVAWQLAGPTNIEGRISIIAIHPTNPQIVYTGTANGGVWKSTNFCQSWVSVFDNQNTSSIGALAIDPVNPNIIYCGTGEANSLRSYYPGTGMFKSTDGGTTWSNIGLINTYSFGNIVINPLNTQEIYAAAVGSLRRKNTERGLYKSTNGGTTWTQPLFHSDSVGCIDVVLNSTTPSIVYAAMWERQRREDYIKYGGPMSALYKSTNSGANWTVLTGGFPSNDATLGRVSLDICKANTQVIYAFTAYANGNSRGLYKTTDGGTSWTLINSGVAQSSNYAWFNRICKVSPSDANNVYCGGLDMYRSTNGGTNFSSVSASHVDHHAVAYAPSNSNYVVIGNDGGIDYSSNGGTSWFASTTLPITQFYAGDISYTNSNVIQAGAQDNGTNRTLTGNLGDWASIYGGDGFYTLVDYQNPQNVYASSQNGGLVRSVDGGSYFSGGTTGLQGSGTSMTNWMTPYVMDKNNPLTLYAGTYMIHRSINGMASWVPISPDLTNGHVQNLGTITTVDVSKSNPNVIYCGTDDANVWVTTNGGTNWTKINSGLPYRWVTRVTIHPDSANICYVTLSGYKVDSTGAHIFRTTNYGNTWTSIAGNLPNAPINDVLIDPADIKTLYIATDIAVMYSTNLGASWQVLGTGFPTNVPCHDLTIHPPTRTLVVWTHGRSAYKIILPFVGVNNNNETAKGFKLFQNYPNPFNPKTIINYQLPMSSEVKLVIYDLMGREAAVLVNKQQNAGSYEIEWNASDYSSGVYFCKLISGNYSDIKRMILIK